MREGAQLTTGLADDLRHAIARDGCPVCRVLRADEDGYWDGLLYEGFQDPNVVSAYRAAAGLCVRHLAQLGARDDPFAAATLARASMQGAIDAVERAARPGRRRRNGGLPRPGQACPVCQTLRGHEAHAVDTLAQLLDAEPDTRQRFVTSDGPCLAHLTLALERNQPVADLLRAHFLAVAADRAAAVQRFLDAHEYRSNPPTPEDAQGWRRAFATLRDAPGRLGDAL